MKPEERKAAFDLLGTNDPYFIGNWADHQRQNHPETKDWHYVNIPETVVKYKAERDCPSTCVISQLEWARATVSDHHKSKAERREALLWWFHLTGDLYQPFHCFGKQEGGNDIPVYFQRKWTNLHKLWDDGIIKSKHFTLASMDSAPFNSFKIPEVTPTFAEAANLSHSRAVEAALPKNATVYATYVRRWWHVILQCFWEAACMSATIGPAI